MPAFHPTRSTCAGFATAIRGLRRESFTALLVCISLAAPALATPQNAVPPGHDIFEPLHAVSPASFPTGMACSPSGKYLYVGEGATITVLDPSGSGMVVPLKTFQLSSQAIVPVAMALDPDADVESQDPTGAADLMYVAAGRDGLWVFRADPRAGFPNAAYRVDDSPSGNPSDQSGRHYASALDFVTVGETDYLVVVFAAQDDS